MTLLVSCWLVLGVSLRFQPWFSTQGVESWNVLLFLTFGFAFSHMYTPIPELPLLKPFSSLLLLLQSHFLCSPRRETVLSGASLAVEDREAESYGSLGIMVLPQDLCSGYTSAWTLSRDTCLTWSLCLSITFLLRSFLSYLIPPTCCSLLTLLSFSFFLYICLRIHYVIYLCTVLIVYCLFYPTRIRAHQGHGSVPST